MSVKPSKVALVTGANGGIGRATVDALAAAGFIAVGAARRSEAVEELRAAGVPAVRIDVTDEASMVSGLAETQRIAGSVGVLVNNAGYGLAGPIELLEMDDVRRQFETNVFGLVRMCQLVLPAMREREAGRIINISSIAGEITLPGQGAYHASKYAVEAFSDALRVEVAPFGIDVVLVQPTGVRTSFFETIDDSAGVRDEGVYAALMSGWRDLLARTQQSPGGMIEPGDVARVITRAATAKHPKARYKAGWSASAMAAVKTVLPDRALDAGVQRALGWTRKKDH
jgi:NAD(P)-dependent dehydrogenase (short-subunit alcohol dehydrogenase family)